MCRANDPRYHPYVTGADVDQASAAVLAALLFPCATLGILQGDFCGLTSAIVSPASVPMEAGEGAECWHVRLRPRRRKAHHVTAKKQQSATTATATIPTTTDDARLPGLLFSGWLSVFWIFLSEIGTSMPSSVRRLGLLDL